MTTTSEMYSGVKKHLGASSGPNLDTNAGNTDTAVLQAPRRTGTATSRWIFGMTVGYDVGLHRAGTCLFSWGFRQAREFRPAGQHTQLYIQMTIGSNTQHKPRALLPQRT